MRPKVHVITISRQMKINEEQAAAKSFPEPHAVEQTAANGVRNTIRKRNDGQRITDCAFWLDNILNAFQICHQSESGHVFFKFWFVTLHCRARDVSDARHSNTIEMSIFRAQ